MQVQYSKVKDYTFGQEPYGGGPVTGGVSFFRQLLVFSLDFEHDYVAFHLVLLHGKML